MRRGRPVDEDKRHLILDKAREAALANGWAGVTMEGVAAAAGVSKVTLYNRFGDRAGLIRDLVGRESERMEKGLERRSFAGALEESLVRFGTEFLSFWSLPETRAFDALVTLAAQGEHRALAEAFVNAGPRKLGEALATRLAEAHAAGQVQATDPGQAAEDLIALWQASLSPEQRFGLESAWSLEAGVRRACSVFLRAYKREEP